MAITLLIATRNPGKFHKISRRLSDHVRVVSLNELGIEDDVEETGATYEENAALKAYHYAERFNMLTLADDGGLRIDALQGAPGLYSARFAGKGATDEQKIEKILTLMEHVPDNQRSAAFNVVLALAKPNGEISYYHGELNGVITRKPRGKLLRGMPYRTIFFVPEYGKTLAEIDALNIKITDHRDKAIGKLRAEFNLG
ncbi:MAG TPA: non-canonical purine NTP pyrophosphatase [Candidatus Babeliales bacterium]|nr:non-canonical purine NTP pyrophosphatase [Candidatus Babeliales bacterium]